MLKDREGVKMVLVCVCNICVASVDFGLVPPGYILLHALIRICRWERQITDFI